jgi:hypothetical protein
MPYTMPGDLHVNRELTTVSIAYAQQSGFISDQVFPNVPSDNPTDFYNKMGRKSFLQAKSQKRAPRTETPGTDWNFTRDTFACEVWGLHHDIEDQYRATADNQWDLDRTGTELVTQDALLRRELEWMAAFFTTGVWTENMAGVAAAPAAGQFLQFDQAGSSPITVFRQARRRFNKRTGTNANTLVLGPDAWDTFIDHPEIVDRVKYTQEGFLTEAIVARAIGIGRILVAEAVQALDDGDELNAELYPATDYIAGNHALMCYAAPRPSREQPSAGYTFSWTGYLGASAWGGRIKKFRMENVACDRIEIEAAYDMKVVAPELGTFMTNVTGTVA